jgi:hypothetical protein
MQLENATNLELRLAECCYLCETQLPASELETKIVSCLSDAANELQRLREIIKSQLNIEVDSYPRLANKAPWAKDLFIGKSSPSQFWVRFTASDGTYYWLHPLKDKWIPEPLHIGIEDFSNYASAQLAAEKSPKPPTWNA